MLMLSQGHAYAQSLDTGMSKLIARCRAFSSDLQLRTLDGSSVILSLDPRHRHHPLYLPLQITCAKLGVQSRC